MKQVELEGEARTAWWRVDPETGRTIGVTQEGLHGETSEYVALVKHDQILAFLVRTPEGYIFAERTAWTWPVIERLFVLGKVTVRFIRTPI